MEWNEDEALRALSESVEVSKAATEAVRGLLLNDETAKEAADLAFQLKEKIHEIPVGGSREQYMSRTDARTIMRLCNQLSKQLDIEKFLRMTTDLMSQTKTLMEMMRVVKSDFTVRDKTEDWESLLTLEQLTTVMGWVEENKGRHVT